MHGQAQPQQNLARCEGCPHGFARLVGGRGDPKSKLVIVGESPGTQEVKAGLPFVGPSGRILEHALKLHPDIEPLILNAIQCFPGVKTKDEDKVKEATHCCQQRLHREILEYPRNVILALGNPAIWSTTWNFSLKSTQCRGKLFGSKQSKYGVVVTTHPAYLLRGGGSLRQFVADVDYACRLSKDGDTKRYILPKFIVARNAKDIKWLAKEVAKQEYVSVDCETGGYNGLDVTRDHILCVGYCWEPNCVYVVPQHLIESTRLIFQRAPPTTKFIWHNGKFDVRFHWKLEIPARVDEDTLLLSYALDETKGIHDLEQVTSDILGFPNWKFMIHEYLGKGKTYADIPTHILYDYMARDISATLQIFPFLRRQVVADPILELLYTRTLIPYSNYVAKIEMNGILPDKERILKNQLRKTRHANACVNRFNKIAVDSEFGALNPRSPQQVSHFLYHHLKLKDPRFPRRVPASTNEAVLVTLEPHRAVETLLKHREVQKALGTYVNSVEEHIGSDGRVHCSYLIHGTTTGRLASRDPNLLNIPRDPILRDQFTARHGYVLMEVDVSQAELRVLAELSGDPVLYRIYTDPTSPSIHLVTQIEMFGNPKEYTPELTKWFMQKFSATTVERMLTEQNMRAKTVNFGIIYGRTAASVAEEFKMPVAEAQGWIDKWFQKYSVAREFILRCRTAPQKNQNLVTPFGRKRRFQIVDPKRLVGIQNQAANFLEQSIASDIVAHVGMQIQDYAKRRYGADIINTVYDSVLFELPANEYQALLLGTDVLKLLKKIPREWGLTHIPFVGDIKLGKSWGSLVKTKLPQHLQAEISNV